MARNLRLPAAKRKDIRIDLRPTERRDNNAQDAGAELHLARLSLFLVFAI